MVWGGLRLRLTSDCLFQARQEYRQRWDYEFAPNTAGITPDLPTMVLAGCFCPLFRLN